MASRITLNGGAPDSTVTVNGPAFVKYDPSAHVLGIFVFDASTTPAPSCDLVATNALGNVQTGGPAMLFSSGFDGSKANGDRKLDVVGFAVGNAETFRVSGGPTDGVVLRIDGYTDKLLFADVASDATARMQATGSVKASVCPDGDLGPAVIAPPKP